MDINILRPEDLKSEFKVIVYGHHTCPYCKQVKEIFENDLKVAIDFRNIKESEVAAQEQEKLGNFLKYETIPMVFIKNKFYGGCSDVKELIAKGELAGLLA